MKSFASTLLVFLVALLCVTAPADLQERTAFTIDEDVIVAAPNTAGDALTSYTAGQAEGEHPAWEHATTNRVQAVRSSRVRLPSTSRLAPPLIPYRTERNALRPAAYRRVPMRL